jgi:hypothetical protein
MLFSKESIDFTTNKITGDQHIILNVMQSFTDICGAYWTVKQYIPYSYSAFIEVHLFLCDDLPLDMYLIWAIM